MNKLQVKPTIAQVILQQLRTTASQKMLCWRVHNFIGMRSGLSFRVSGMNHKGHVYVIYDEG